jgi:hypothetical protein
VRHQCSQLQAVKSGSSSKRACWQLAYHGTQHPAALQLVCCPKLPTSKLLLLLLLLLQVLTCYGPSEHNDCHV